MAICTSCLCSASRRPCTFVFVFSLFSIHILLYGILTTGRRSAGRGDAPPLSASREKSLSFGGACPCPCPCPCGGAYKHGVHKQLQSEPFLGGRLSLSLSLSLRGRLQTRCTQTAAERAFPLGALVLVLVLAGALTNTVYTNSCRASLSSGGACPCPCPCGGAYKHGVCAQTAALCTPQAVELLARCSSPGRGGGRL
jgi:hypothetical protein